MASGKLVPIKWSPELVALSGFSLSSWGMQVSVTSHRTFQNFCHDYYAATNWRISDKKWCKPTSILQTRGNFKILWSTKVEGNKRIVKSLNKDCLQKTGQSLTENKRVRDEEKTSIKKINWTNNKGSSLFWEGVAAFAKVWYWLLL